MPGEIGEIIPVAVPIEATEVLLLLQTPLPEASLKAVVVPLQITLLPVIAAGVVLTVTEVELLPHPFAARYIIVAEADGPTSPAPTSVK